MPGDSTELTFVRCPSCRSLVPAMSTRCRMCGATLDAAQKVDQSQADIVKQGRVRQRTMSKPGDNLNAATEELRQNTSQESAESRSGSASEGLSEPVAPKGSPGPKRSISADDPLGSFVEEVPVESESATVEQVATSSDQRIESENGHTTNGVTHIQPAVQPPVAPFPEKSTPVRNEPRTVSESETGKPRQSGGLSFSRSAEGSRDNRPKPNRESEPRAETQRPPVRTQESRPAESERRRDEHQEPRPERNETRTPTEEGRRSVRPDPRSDQTNIAESRPRQEQRSPRIETQQPQPVRPQNPGPRLAEHKAGRLMGWLVNYNDPDGSAIELREGKFFVTRSSLKSNDLVIDEDSVSTPHAVVRVAGDTGLEVQDLMSDGGVFVRKKGSDSYRKEDERFVVQHGDWLKFGEYEFLVSLIAHVGVK